MAQCRNGHSLSVVGRVSVRWCPECSTFELRVWAVGQEDPVVTTLIPEWADVVRVPGDDWADRTFTKYMTGLAHTVRTLEDDERRGIARLPLE